MSDRSPYAPPEDAGSDYFAKLGAIEPGISLPHDFTANFHRQVQARKIISLAALATQGVRAAFVALKWPPLQLHRSVESESYFNGPKLYVVPMKALDDFSELPYELRGTTGEVADLDVLRSLDVDKLADLVLDAHRTLNTKTAE